MKVSLKEKTKLIHYQASVSPTGDLQKQTRNEFSLLLALPSGCFIWLMKTIFVVWSGKLNRKQTRSFNLITIGISVDLHPLVSFPLHDKTSSLFFISFMIWIIEAWFLKWNGSRRAIDSLWCRFKAFMNLKAFITQPHLHYFWFLFLAVLNMQSGITWNFNAS